MENLPRFFENYLGNEMEYFHEGLGFTFPAMASCVGTFLYQPKRRILRFDWHSWSCRQAFNDYCNLLLNRSYSIQGNDFDTYLEANSAIFGLVELTTKQIAGSFLNADFSNLVLREALVSPSSANLYFDFEFSNGDFAFRFSREKENYHALINQLQEGATEENPSLVTVLVNLAKARVASTDNFFATAIDVLPN